MFRLKILSFSSKDKNGSLFEVNLSPDRPLSVVSRQIGFKAIGRQERKPAPQRRFAALSLFEAFFKPSEEEG